MALEQWTIDRTRSEIGFSVRHLALARVRGRFDDWNGRLDFDPNDPEKSRVEIVLHAASLTIGHAEFDAQLRSPGFLNSRGFPHICFRSTRIDGVTLDEYEVVGQLTIAGITRTVILDATRSSARIDDQGCERVTFVVGGHIDRKDFGLTWNRALETGELAVGDRVTITIKLEAYRVPESRQVPDSLRATT